jgi:hypothetical protein
MRALVATAVAVAVVAAGGAPAVGAGAASPAAEGAIARAGVLVLSDFPSGWSQVSRPKSSDAALDALAGKFKSCAPFLAFSRTSREHPRVQSPNFDDGQSQVSNSVSVYSSPETASAAMKTFADARMHDCIGRIYTSLFRKELTQSKAVADRIRSVKTSVAPVPDIHVGDEAIAYQGVTDVGLKDGTTQAIGLGIVSTRVGGAVASYSWSADVDISAALQPAIVTSVARLQAAPASQ